MKLLMIPIEALLKVLITMGKLPGLVPPGSTRLQKGEAAPSNGKGFTGW